MGFAVELFLPHSSRQTSPEELLQLHAVTLVHDFLAQSQFQVLTSSVVGVEWEWQELSTSNIISTTYLQGPSKVSLESTWL